MPGIVMFGYNVSTVLLAGVALYAAYVFIEAATWTTSALLVVPPSSNRLWHGWWTIPLMPAYRYFVFWMRFAGVPTGADRSAPVEDDRLEEGAPADGAPNRERRTGEGGIGEALAVALRPESVELDAICSTEAVWRDHWRTSASST